ncbi:hypothetical protein EYF80_067360 [Liparis tanakae]|uniref:Uncharacterized protein n=1 Tax=Liparis tanakae TaxID=230148 RepID=A0A4Z2E120_9TELE|nr:hypothetical protein EYF80_067360 [Liparis tanakae]
MRMLRHLRVSWKRVRRSVRTRMWDREEMKLSTTAYHSWNGSMVYTVKMMKRKKGTWKHEGCVISRRPA